MDKNEYLLNNEGGSTKANVRACAAKRWRVLAAGLVFAVGGIWLLLHQMLGHSGSSDEYALGALKGDKVQVELFVMSRCPDAIKVETVFNSVVRELYPILDIQLNFIAKPNPNATYGAECKHGDEECRGNIDELCALAHGGDLPLFWRFLNCLNSHSGDIGSDPDLSLKCASSAGLDTEAFINCALQVEGRELFRQSVENAQFAGVNTSATVFIDGHLRCVEDGGWRECPGGHSASDFIRDICAAYKGSRSRPSICAEYPPVA
ncbi:hypothetical protein IW148_001270 [Coemansia sp. RSA 1199]|nr:hypothetical protein IW148_001270 [Coemansia sp. RSA 1199]